MLATVHQDNAVSILHFLIKKKQLNGFFKIFILSFILFS